ncbi:MAG: 4Fe-4S dicluster domain-containing protein [Halarsenatibacteraceae bacterium]
MSNEKNRESRRNFLKKGAAGAAALIAGFGMEGSQANAENLDAGKKAILMDQSLCVECQACRLACQRENDFPITAQSIKFKSIESGTYPEVEYNSTRWSCFHCSDAPCIEVCPVDAIERKNGEMNVTDIETCIGCGACLQACPYDVPEIIEGKMYKCNGCNHLLAEDEEPACVTTCPAYALEFGNQKEMAEFGTKRIEELEADGQEAYLYGLEAQDGLGLFLILRTAPEDFELV